MRSWGGVKRAGRPSACDRALSADLPLELKDSVEQRLRRRRAARNIDVDRNDAVAAANYRIAIVIVAATIGAAAHGDDVARLAHLVVNPSKRRSHLVAERAGNDHHIRLARARARSDAKPFKVIARHVHVDHLDRAAGKAEGHPPQRPGPGPGEQVLALRDEEALAVEFVTHLLEEL